MTPQLLLERIAEARQKPLDRDRMEEIRTLVWALLSTGPLRKGGEWENAEASMLCWCVLLLDQALGVQPLPEYSWDDATATK